MLQRTAQSIARYLGDEDQWSDDESQGSDDGSTFLDLLRDRRDRRRHALGGGVRASVTEEVDPLSLVTQTRSRRRTKARRQTMVALDALGLREDDSLVISNLHQSRYEDLESRYGDEQDQGSKLINSYGRTSHASHHGTPTSHQHHSHQGLMLPLYCSPVQRQLWDDDQVLPHVNWYDLFFDLIFVAAAYNLGVMLVSAMNGCDWPRGVVYFIGIFGPLYSIWENDVIYASRYTLVDYFHRFVAVLRFLCVSFIVLSIKPLHLLADKSSAETFCLVLALLCESLIQVGLNLELYLYGDGDRKSIQNQTKRETFSFLLPSMLTYLAATIISGWTYFHDHETSSSASSSSYTHDDLSGHASEQEDDNTNHSYGSSSTPASYGHRALAVDTNSGSSDVGYPEEHCHGGVHWSIADLPIFLCLGIFIFNLIMNQYQTIIHNKRQRNIRDHFVPNNIDYMIHRYGEWLMLMIGESILSLLIVETIESTEYYLITGFGCLTVIVLQMLLFESQPSHADDGHALWRSMTAAALFSVLIQILSMGLIAFGVSYKLFLHDVLVHVQETESHVSDEANRHLAEVPHITRKAEACLFCASLALILVTLELMSGTHKGIFKCCKSLFRVKQGNPPVLSPYWPLIVISIIKLSLIMFTVTLPLWKRDPFAITIFGFMLVTVMAMIRIVGYGFIHHEDYIKRAMSSFKDSIRGAVSVTAKSMKDELGATMTSHTSPSVSHRRCADWGTAGMPTVAVEGILVNNHEANDSLSLYESIYEDESSTEMPVLNDESLLPSSAISNHQRHRNDLDNELIVVDGPVVGGTLFGGSMTETRTGIPAFEAIADC